MGRLAGFRYRESVRLGCLKWDKTGRHSLSRKDLERLAWIGAFAYSEAMEVHFAPDLQAKLDELATATGRPPCELVEDVVAGYFDELAETRAMLNSRYDDLKSGRVKPIDGEAFFESLRQQEDELLKKQ
jgi:predicted transcriptional regulator